MSLIYAQKHKKFSRSHQKSDVNLRPKNYQLLSRMIILIIRFFFCYHKISKIKNCGLVISTHKQHPRVCEYSGKIKVNHCKIFESLFLKKPIYIKKVNIYMHSSLTHSHNNFKKRIKCSY